jgi:molybdopterin converting factor subunit 1
MRVKVRLFARLRDLAGCGRWTCHVPAGASVGDVWRQVVAAHPALEPYGASVSSALNANFARMTAPVQDGDEVAFLPPVSGGSGGIGSRHSGIARRATVVGNLQSKRVMGNRGSAR